MGIKITGFDEVKNKLNQLQNNAKKLEGTKSVSFDELFNDSFMSQHTNFSNLEEFFEAGSFKANSKEDFEAIPDSKLDEHVSKTTKFSSWKDMLDEAVKEFTIRKLGL
jgi:hypothetical protein